MTIYDEVGRELERANMHGDFNSPHEGYAVILKELDELKAEVWKNGKTRDYVHMRKEAIEVAAMGIKFVQMLDRVWGFR